MMEQLQYFTDIGFTSADAEVTLDDVIDQIRTNRPNNIDLLWTLPKKSAALNDQKRGRPAVMWNAITNGGTANNDDVISVHELIYLDIDNVPHEEVEGLKSALFSSFPFVEACWRSISGRGVGFIVRTKGNTKNLFSSVKKHLVSLFQGQGYQLDKGSISLTRKNFISYDPLVLRRVPTPLDVRSLGLSEKSAESSIKKGALGYTGPRTFLRLTDHDTYFQGEFQDHKHRYFPEGAPIIKVEGAYRKVTTNRNNHLFHNMMRLFYLNQHLREIDLIRLAKSMNTNQIMDPLEENEVEHIARSVFNGEYIPEPNHSLKLVYNPKFKNRTSANKLIAQENKHNRDKEIYDAIEAYDLPQKLTIKSLAAHSGISQDRLKRAWSTFKDYVRSLNEQRKTDRPPLQKRAGASVVIEEKILVQENLATYICDTKEKEHEEQDISEVRGGLQGDGRGTETVQLPEVDGADGIQAGSVPASPQEDQCQPRP